MTTFETYLSDYGIGYRIFVDGVMTTDQPFAPGMSGFVSMSQAEATTAAQALVDAAGATP
jgi:hypothetical protein